MKNLGLACFGLALLFAWLSLTWMLLDLGWSMFWHPPLGESVDRIMGIMFWFFGLAFAIGPFAAGCGGKNAK